MKTCIALLIPLLLLGCGGGHDGGHDPAEWPDLTALDAALHGALDNPDTAFDEVLEKSRALCAAPVPAAFGKMEEVSVHMTGFKRLIEDYQSGANNISKADFLNAAHANVETLMDVCGLAHAH